MDRSVVMNSAGPDHVKCLMEVTFKTTLKGKSELDAGRPGS